MVTISTQTAQFETVDGLRVTVVLHVEDPQGVADLVSSDILQEIEDYVDEEEQGFFALVRELADEEFAAMGYDVSDLGFGHNGDPQWQ